MAKNVSTLGRYMNKIRSTKYELKRRKAKQKLIIRKVKRSKKFLSRNEKVRRN